MKKTTWKYYLFLIFLSFPHECITQSNHSEIIDSDSIDYAYNQYYLNIESQRTSYGSLDSLYIFDKKRSVQNIINEFGINFFSKSPTELLENT